MRSLAVVVLAVACAAHVVGLSYVELSSPDQVMSSARRVLREEMDRERQAFIDDGGDPDDFEFPGWGPDTSIRKRAEEAGVKRGLLTGTTEDGTSALLGKAEGTQLLALPTAADYGSLATSATTQQLSATSAGQVALAAKAAALTDAITEGAIVNTGALPRDVGDMSSLADKARKRNDRSLGMGGIDWLLSTEVAEQEALDREQNATLKAVWEAELRNVSADLHAWFTERGGKMTFVRPVNDSLLSDGTPARPHLEALEGIEDGEVVLSMPLRLTLSLLSTRHTKTPRGSSLHTTLKPVFEQREDWGLALLVLTEYFKHKEATKPPADDIWGRHQKKKKKKKKGKGDDGSTWGPFLRSLRVNTPSMDVLKQLKGSYTLEVLQEWEADAAELERFLRKKHICLGSGSDICSREPSRLGSQSLAETDLRWALWAVHQHAIHVTKRSTQERFLALVPFSNLLQHSPTAGGNITFELDNTIRVAVGAHSAGDGIGVDLGPASDAVTLLSRGVVDEGHDNPHNTIKLVLPATPTPDNADDLFWQLDTLREWRKAMRLPPRLSDLWRLTEQLHLFGDGEEEQNLLSGANSRRADLPLSADQATAEEQLMLVYGVDDAGAQVALYGDADLGSLHKPQLYAAPDIEEDPMVETVMEDLAEAVRQLSDAVIMAHGDNSTQDVINSTRNFLEYGVMPSRGLDGVDQILLRKISLLRQCGTASEYLLTAGGNVSQPLYCAARVFLMNDTDLDLVCPKADGPWLKPKCEGDDFDPAAAVSRGNEELATQALLSAVNDLLVQYPTTVEDDQSLLMFGGDDLPPGSLLRSAVVTRMREKQLLKGTVALLTDRLARLDAITYATTKAVAAQQQREEDAAAEAEWRATVLAAASVRAVVVNVSVDLPDATVYLVVREGDTLEDNVAHFAALYNLPPADAALVTQAALDKAPTLDPMELAVPVVTPDGVRRMLVVHAGENITLAVKTFCVVHNVTGQLRDAVNATTLERYAARQRRQVLLRMPVTAPDGRRLQLLVREGDQHEMASTVSDFVSAYYLPSGAVHTLAVEALNRLPVTVFTVPVTSPGQRRLLLRILDGDEAKLVTVVRTFCEVWQLPDSNVAALVQAARRGLHPDAMVLPPDVDNNA